MATLDEMYSALRNADAAGAADDARLIADRIAEMQQKSANVGLPGTVADAAKSVGSGVVRGTAMLAGTGGDLNALMNAGSGAMQNAGYDVAGAKQEALNAMPAWMRRQHEKPQADFGSQKIMSAIDEKTGLPITSYEPKTDVGRVGQKIGEFVPASMLGGGGIVRGAVLSGAGSELGRKLAEGTKYEVPAQIAGAVLGGSVLPKKTSLTAKNLGDAADLGYNNPAVKNLRIDPAGPARLADDAVVAMEAKGARPYIAQTAYQSVDELRNLPNTTAAKNMQAGGLNPAATVEDVKGVRTVLNKVTQDGTDALTGKLNTSANAANVAKRKISDYLDNIPPSDVVAGDAAAAGAALRDATGNYAAKERMRVVDALTRRAEVNTGSANSGQNINNQTRQQLKSLLLNEKKNAGFNKAEMGQLERAVLGTKTGNAARFVGNALAPSGAMLFQNSASVGGLGAGAAYLLGGDPAQYGAAAAVGAQVLGRGARRIGNASTARQTQKFRDMVSSRAPLANDREMLRALGISPTTTNLSLVQALMAAERPQQPTQPVPALR
jgi:hypothetical protein